MQARRPRCTSSIIKRANTLSVGDTRRGARNFARARTFPDSADATCRACRLHWRARMSEEAIAFRDAIARPITNAHFFLAEALRDGVNW